MTGNNGVLTMNDAIPANAFYAAGTHRNTFFPTLHIYTKNKCICDFL